MEVLSAVNTSGVNASGVNASGVSPAGPIGFLVVEDDFRVARIHTQRALRVPGFECVGEVRTAAEARETILTAKPELMLLDVYLPDEDGISLLRSLRADDNAPDCILITAAHDLETVRAAVRAGVIYYLVKPFGFEKFKWVLETYREWRNQLASAAVADQATIDALYRLLRPAGAEAPRNKLPLTMQRVLDTVRAASHPVGATEIATELGTSRPTAQRYLTALESQGVIELQLEYGTTGRPTNEYRPRT